MSGYFARLVTRAAGNVGAIAPTTSRPPAESGDPFEATAPLETAPARASELEPVPVPLSQTGTAAAMALPTPAKQAPSVLREVRSTASEPARLVEPRMDALVAPPSPPAPPPEDIETSANPWPHVPEPPRRDPSPDAPMVAEPAKVAPALPPTAPRVEEPARNENAEKPEREPALIEPRQQPVMPVPAPQPLARAVPQTLEPQRTERTTAPPQPEQEPRLVIGRMRVDVLPAPAPPTRPPQPVQVVERTAAPQHAPSLPSQLRFGLGQM
jgi:hypothetical protein